MSFFHPYFSVSGIWESHFWDPQPQPLRVPGRTSASSDDDGLVPWDGTGVLRPDDTKWRSDASGERCGLMAFQVILAFCTCAALAASCGARGVARSHGCLQSFGALHSCKCLSLSSSIEHKSIQIGSRLSIRTSPTRWELHYLQTLEEIDLTLDPRDVG